MTLDQALTTMRTLADRQVVGTTYADGVLSADVVTTDDQHVALADAFYQLAEAATIVLAVIEFALAREAVQGERSTDR